MSDQQFDTDIEQHFDYNKPRDCSARLEIAKIHLLKEFEIVKYAWPIFLLCMAQNYNHSFAHNLAYYLHVPRRTIYDLGFAALPALDSTLQAMSEYLFFIIIIGIVSFCLLPMFHDNRESYARSMETTNGIGQNRNDRLILRKDGFYIWNRRNSASPPVYFIHMLMRFLTTMGIASFIRLTCFLITGLPGPNYHCRPFSPFYNPPITLPDLLFRSDVFFSCGDLVFSSHTTFIILAALTYIKYGQMKIMKLVSWGYVVLFATLVLCARKHYTIDILMALYVVPLVWVANDTLFPDKYTKKMVDADIPLPVESEAEAKLHKFAHYNGMSNSNMMSRSSFNAINIHGSKDDAHDHDNDDDLQQIQRLNKKTTPKSASMNFGIDAAPPIIPPPENDISSLASPTTATASTSYSAALHHATNNLDVLEGVNLDLDLDLDAMNNLDIGDLDLEALDSELRDEDF